jgi:Bacteriocin-protection, YdeI or OmpD-Associated
MLCSMASFKEHAAFGFWNGSLVLGDKSKNAEAMGQLGRLTAVSDLPPKGVLASYIKLKWISDAKSPKTRARRLQTAIEWLTAGKSRNWKYMPK